MLSLSDTVLQFCVSFHRLRAKGSRRHYVSFAAIRSMQLKSCVFGNAKIRNLPILYRYCISYELLHNVC